MKIYCCHCKNNIEARLTNGGEIYPHRPDLYKLPFWVCDTCNNFVGTHHKSKNKTKPLGCIPTKEIKEARKHIHNLLDPLWQKGLFKRSHLYLKIAQKMGIKEYHTAEIRSIEEARKVYNIIKGLADDNN